MAALTWLSLTRPLSREKFGRSMLNAQNYSCVPMEVFTWSRRSTKTNRWSRSSPGLNASFSGRQSLISFTSTRSTQTTSTLVWRRKTQKFQIFEELNGRLLSLLSYKYDSNFNSICLKLRFSYASAASEVNYDARHVVAAFSHGASNVWWKTSVEPIIANLIQADFSLHLHVDVVDHLLVGMELPDSVTAHNDEVNLWGDWNRSYVWKTRYLLLLHVEPLILLVGEVSNSPR